MAIDTSSYAQAAGADRSVGDYQLQNQGIAQNALNLQRSRQQLDAYTQDQAEKQSLRNYLAGSPDLSTAQGYNGLMSAAPTLGPGIHKTYQDSITSAALANKDNGAAAESHQKVQDQAWAHYQNSLGTVQSPQEAVSYVTAMYHDPIVGPMLQAHGSLEEGLARLQQATTSPEAFQQWKANAAIGMQKLAELAKVQTVDTGGATSTQVYQPATGQVSTVASATKTATPGEVLQANTSRANNAANINKDLTVAGMKGDGTLSDNLEAEAHMIAAGRAAPPSGMAATRPAAAALMRRVSELNPEYDATTYGAKVAAAKGFTSGQQGNQLRSFATSGQHLDQLGELIDALDNGNNHTINAVGNTISSWNGNTPVTNFDAAKDVVAKEVMKAIVAGGGGQAEREELAKSLSSANSPQQLKGVVKQYRNLMTAQADNLMEQRRAAGLADSTLPHYATPKSSAAPADLSGFKITHVDGKPQ